MSKLPNPCRCGNDPAVWMSDGVVLIQCQNPNCGNTEIIGQYTHLMAVIAWDAHQAHASENTSLRAELEQAKFDVEQWSSSSGFFSDSLAMANESAAVLQAERDKYAAALVEIRGICTAMMDGWGQTVTVLAGIRDIVTKAIGFGHPGEKPQRPQTFA